MSWNYRVCKETKEDAISYGIHEAYYNTNDEIWAVTEDAISVYSSIVLEDQSEEECLTEMKLIIDQMREALEKPVIDLDTIKFAERE